MEKQVRLKAVVRQIYGGRLLLPGEEFMANEREAKNYIRMHYADAVNDESPPKRAYRRRDMEAEK